VDVHQPPDGQGAHTRIGLQLCLVRREQLRHGFDLQDDDVGDMYVGAKAPRYLHAFVEDGDANLARKRMPACSSPRPTQAAFQESRSGSTMYFDRQSDDPFGQVSMF